MSEEFESMKRSLEQAIAFAKGDKTQGRMRLLDIPEPDVTSIRKKTGLSQSEFARSISVALSTLQNWEQGRRRPRGPARVLLALIDKQPDIVRKTILG